MRIAILGYGTRGDIQPMLAIGEELIERGHSVVMTVNPNLAAWASRTRIEVIEMPPDLERFFKSDEGRRILARGRQDEFSRAVGQLERDSNPAIIAACLRAADGADLILSTVLTALRGLTLVRRRGPRHAALATFPVIASDRFTHPLWPQRDLRLGVLNRLTWSLAHRMWWRAQRAPVADTAYAAGVAPLERFPDLSKVHIVSLFSELLAPRPADAPADAAFTGFVTLSAELRDRLGEGGVDPALARWLDAGDPPIFFGFGSMPVLDPPALLEQVLEVTRRHNLRALIGAGWTDYGEARGGLPPHAFVASNFDHDRVLPRCRAAVHHGGAGTTAAVLRAGLPALVAAVFADQPYWAWRVEKLGVGVALRYRDFSAARFDECLDRLLDPGTTARARVLGDRLRAEDGVGAACDAIERYARS